MITGILDQITINVGDVEYIIKTGKSSSPQHNVE
jgi:hypothetical protein